MKFDEVTTQFVLTRHVIGLRRAWRIRSKIWDAMKPEQQAKFQAAPTRRSTTTPRKFDAQEAEVDRVLQEGRQEGLRRPTRMLSAPSRRRSTSKNTATTGRRARSSASTPSSNPPANGLKSAGSVAVAGSATDCARLPARQASMTARNIDNARRAGSAAAPRTSPSRCCRVMFATLHHPDLLRATSSTIRSAGRKRSSSRRWLWTRACGARRSFFASREEIRFDIIYSQVSERTRRVFTVITGVAVVVLYGISLPAAYSYVSFMKVERSAYLHVPINWMYSVYHHLRRRLHRAVTAGWSITPFAARSRRRPIPRSGPRLMMPSALSPFASSRLLRSAPSACRSAIR